MKADIKKLFVEDLRKTRARQTKGVLWATTDGFCCLGRLCKLHEKHAPDALKWKNTPHGMQYGTHKYNTELPPNRVLKWAGLHHTTARTLAQKNDLEGMSFKEIADYVDRVL